MGHYGHNVSCQTEPMADKSTTPPSKGQANVLLTCNPIRRAPARTSRQAKPRSPDLSQEELTSQPSAQPRALVIEDRHEATSALSTRGYSVDRIHHLEAASQSGERFYGRLLRGYYQTLWIMSPINYTGAALKRKSVSSHSRFRDWAEHADALQMTVVFFGSRRDDFWIPLQDLPAPFHSLRMRFCSPDLCLQFNPNDPRPSGSYLTVLTNHPLSIHTWRCHCHRPMQEHVLDWPGDSATRSRWRTTAREHCLFELCQELFPPTTPLPTFVPFMSTTKDTEALTPPPRDDTNATRQMVEKRPVQSTEETAEETAEQMALPTEARLRQKEKLKKDRTRNHAKEKEETCRRRKRRLWR